MIAATLLLAQASVGASEVAPTAARRVVETYYAAIERGHYRTAFRLWSSDGRASGQRYAAFVHGFARTAHSAVVTGRPSHQEGAAGSVYVTVPVTVGAVLKDGTRQRFRGTYTLRRVNGVPGATREQLRWRIAAARLRPA